MPLCGSIAGAAAVSLALAFSSGAFAQPDSQTDERSLALFNPDDFVSLDDEPAGQLTDVPVETASGVRIGAVKRVALAPDGSAARVLVDLDAGGSVWIVAESLRYNRNARILLTNLKHIESSADRQSF